MAASLLAEVLAGVACAGGQHNVLVTVERSGRYCQVVVDPLDGAWVEAQSNRFIGDPSARLSAHQEVVLAGLGFEAPDDEVPNHHLRVTPPVAWGEVAVLLVDALAGAYGLTDADVLEVEVYPHVRRPGDAARRCR